MDLLGAIRRDAAERMAQQAERPIAFLAASPDELLEDEVFDYHLVDDLKQMVDLCYTGPAAERALCLLFGADHFHLAKLLATHQDLFPMEFMILNGLPNSVVNDVFNEAVFGLSTASYDRVVGDTVELKRQMSMMTEAELAQSAILREEKSRQTKHGTVRPLIDFDHGSPVPATGDAEDAEAPTTE